MFWHVFNKHLVILYFMNHFSDHLDCVLQNYLFLAVVKLWHRHATRLHLSMYCEFSVHLQTRVVEGPRAVDKCKANSKMWWLAQLEKPEVNLDSCYSLAVIFDIEVKFTQHKIKVNS